MPETTSTPNKASSIKPKHRLPSAWIEGYFDRDTLSLNLKARLHIVVNC